MTDSTLSLRHRIIGKMALLGVLPTAVLLGALVALGVLRELALVEANAERAAESVTHLAVGEMEAHAHHGALVGRLAADALAAGDMLDQAAASTSFLGAILGEHEEFAAVSVIDERSATPRAFTVSRAADDVGIEVAEDQGLVQRAADLRARGRRMVERDRSLSSLNEFVGGDAPALRDAFPLIRDGRFVGLLLLEYSLPDLSGVMARIADEVGGTIHLTNGEQLIELVAERDGPAAAMQSTARLGTVDGSPLERLLRVHLERPGDVRTWTDIDPVQGVTYRYGMGRLRQGEWSLLVRAPAAGSAGVIAASVARNAGIALVGMAVVGSALLIFARRVGRRLDRAVAAARRIAQGDLGHEVPAPDAADESGQLLAAFVQMSDNLNHIVGQVRQASIQINSTATELAATSRQLENTASGFGHSATDVAAATRQISTTGEELLHTMQAVADSAAGTAEKAQESRNGLRSMQTSVRRLDEAATSVAARLGAINEKAQGINTIVGTITKVADETNLLSVNAAIEAEKAGEFGLGFLIVAREIRRLADQTASATLDIERMIRQMQSAVSAGVSEMDRFGESLRTVLDEVDRVGNRVQGIIAHVEDDTLRFVQVTEGMRSQAAGARQIDEAMRELSIGARQTIMSAGEFGNAAAELEQAITALKVTVSSVRLRDGRAAPAPAAQGGES